MPKKPKQIQEKVDKLLREDYRANEIIEKIKKEDGTKISTSYVSTRRKKVKEEKDIPKTSQSLSRKTLNKLYDLQNRLGKKDLDETITTISEDYKTILREKYKYDFEDEKTVAQVFEEFMESHRILNSLDKNESQLKIFEKINREENPLIYYWVEFSKNGQPVNFFDLLAKYTRAQVDAYSYINRDNPSRYSSEEELLEIDRIKK
jgi:hypothetical protein